MSGEGYGGVELSGNIGVKVLDELVRSAPKGFTACDTCGTTYGSVQGRGGEVYRCFNYDLGMDDFLTCDECMDVIDLKVMNQDELP